MAQTVCSHAPSCAFGFPELCLSTHKVNTGVQQVAQELATIGHVPGTHARGCKGGAAAEEHFGDDRAQKVLEFLAKHLCTWCSVHFVCLVLEFFLRWFTEKQICTLGPGKK